MSFDRVKQERLWSGEIHTFKNKIGNAMLIIEMLQQFSSMQGSSTEVSESKKLLDDLSKKISEIITKVEESFTKFKTEEPSAELREKLKNEHLTLLHQVKLMAVSLLGSWPEQQDAVAIENINLLQMSLQQADDFLAGRTTEKDSRLSEFLDQITKPIKTGFAEHKHKNKLSITIDDGLRDAVIKGESSAIISDILENCIANANRFTVNGQINISIKFSDKTHKKVIITIEDNGKGMSEDILAKIREGMRGVTEGGHGEGLADIRKRLDAFGGAVFITSNTEEATHGTTFSWEFPVEKIFQHRHKEIKIDTTGLGQSIDALLTSVRQSSISASAPTIMRSLSDGSTDLSSSPLFSSRPVTESARAPKRKLAKTSAADKETGDEVLIYFLDDVQLNQTIFKRKLDLYINSSEFKTKSKGQKCLVKLHGTPAELIKAYDKDYKRVVGIITDLNLGADVISGDHLIQLLRQKEAVWHPDRRVPMFIYSGDGYPLEPGSGIDGVMDKGAGSTKVMAEFFDKVVKVLPEPMLVSPEPMFVSPKPGQS